MKHRSSAWTFLLYILYEHTLDPISGSNSTLGNFLVRETNTFVSTAMDIRELSVSNSLGAWPANLFNNFL